MQEVLLKTDRPTALFCFAGSIACGLQLFPAPWISRVGTFRRNAGRVAVMQPPAPADLTPR